MTATGAPVALVTGGSRGIGRATVLRLAQDGYRVAFCYTANAEAARRTEKAVAERGGQAVAKQADVSDAAAVTDLVSGVEDELGPIDVLVTSAGIVRDNPLVFMDDADWHRVLDVNLNGTYHVCRSVVFGMMKRRTGCVITISSVAGVHGNPTQTNYSAAKAGIIGFTRALSKEIGRYGIRVNAVAPGFIDTDMTESLDDKARTRLVAGIPLGRFGRPEEVADLVGYLVTAEYVTGAVLQIDGGLST